MNREEIIEKLNKYFGSRNDVAFAYLFGSLAKNRIHAESDIDVGVYFYTKTPNLEYETEQEYEQEEEIWSNIERLTGKKTDLIVLNRAPSTIFYAIMQEGIPIIINDEGLCTRMFLAISSAAEDYREFVNDYYNIMQRSNSISSVDREKLQRIVTFLETEISDFQKFNKITDLEYRQDRDKRRLIERWSENMITSSIDISKILLASEKKPIPQTYKEILRSLSVIDGFDENIANRLSEFSQVRNILAHEYLDLRFAKICKIQESGEKVFTYLLNFTKKIIG